MAPKGWATPEQAQFLQSRLSGFLEAQRNSRKQNFLRPLYTEWFVSFPEPWTILPPEDIITDEDKANHAIALKAHGDAVRKKEEQIHNWFKNHVRPQLRGKIPDDDFKERRSRQLTRIQIYSKKYYNTKIKPALSAYLETNVPNLDELSDSKERRAVRLKALNKVAKDCWDNETPEIIEEIEDEFDEAQARAAEKKGLKVTELAEGLSPEEYQKNIDDLPSVIQRRLELYTRKTGYVFFLAAGGPCPRAGGDIQVFSMSTGMTEAGNVITGMIPGFKDVIMSPFADFVRKACSHEVRAKRSLRSAAHPSKPTTAGLSTEAYPSDPTAAGPSVEAHLSAASPPAHALKNSSQKGKRGRTRYSEALVNSDFENYLAMPSDSEDDNESILPVSKRPRQVIAEPPVTSPLVVDSVTAPPPLVVDPVAASPPPIADPVTSPPLVVDSVSASPPLVVDSVSASPPLVIDSVTASPPPIADPVTSPPLVVDSVSASLPLVVDPVTTSPSPIADPVTSPPLVVDSVSASHPLVIDPVIASPPPIVDPVTSPLVVNSICQPVSLAIDSSPALPTWYITSLAFFNKQEFGIQWNQVVSRWSQIESSMGFGLAAGYTNGFVSESRPSEVVEWISKGRDLASPPAISSSKEFGIRWMAWWKDLQPAWRKGSSRAKLPAAIYHSDKDWDSLKKSGPDGFVLLLIAFVWWGKSGDSQDWHRVETDIARTLQCMVKLF